MLLGSFVDFDWVSCVDVQSTTCFSLMISLLKGLKGLFPWFVHTFPRLNHHFPSRNHHFLAKKTCFTMFFPSKTMVFRGFPG